MPLLKFTASGSLCVNLLLRSVLRIINRGSVNYGNVLMVHHRMNAGNGACLVATNFLSH